LQHLAELGPIYTRLNNPTQEVIENRIASLEGGVGALLLASGQAAITYAILNIAGAGDHIVASPSIYGGTYNLLKYTLADLGVETTFVENPDDLQQWRDAVRPNTNLFSGEPETGRMIYLRSPYLTTSLRGHYTLAKILPDLRRTLYHHYPALNLAREARTAVAPETPPTTDFDLSLQLHKIPEEWKPLLNLPVGLDEGAELRASYLGRTHELNLQANGPPPWAGGTAARAAGPRARRPRRAGRREGHALQGRRPSAGPGRLEAPAHRQVERRFRLQLRRRPPGGGCLRRSRRGMPQGAAARAGCAGVAAPPGVRGRQIEA